jgi:hypothetical protein
MGALGCGQSRSAPKAGPRPARSDVITELTRRDRSARLAARSLACLKFRFVSSPLLGPNVAKAKIAAK